MLWDAIRGHFWAYLFSTFLITKFKWTELASLINLTTIVQLGFHLLFLQLLTLSYPLFPNTFPVCIGAKKIGIFWATHEQALIRINYVLHWDIISQANFKITKLFFLLCYFNRTSASVLFLGYRYFELRNNYKQFRICVRIPISIQ